MADIKSKEMAQKIRKEGKSINEITNILNKPKSTIAYWCRNIRLTKSQEKKLKAKRSHAGREMLIKNAKNKHEEYQKLLKENQKIGICNVKNFTDRDLDMLCIGLYWGEGYKYASGEFGFTNSDPDMIKIYLKWLYKLHNVSKDRIILRVSINNVHEDRIDDVLNFWQSITKLPKKQFTKTSFIKSKSKKIYSNHDEHMGTLRVKVSMGAAIRAKVIGSIKALG